MRALRIALLSTAVVAGLLAAGVGISPATPPWAPASRAAIHPGVQTFTEGAQCTANFVFTSAGNVYLGQAAHCAGTAGPTSTDGCDSPSLPLGTAVEVEGASRPGVLAYSSWLTMQDLGETDADTCQYNDLALVRIDPVDAGKVNPSMPHWGGPVGLAAGSGPPASSVYSFGNSELRLGLALLKPKLGISVRDQGNGWSHQVLTVTPGLPGDSGSGFLDSTGHALGILSTFEVLPLPATNGVGDLRLELDYMHSQSPLDAQLAVGTVAFNGAKLPLGV